MTTSRRELLVGAAALAACSSIEGNIEDGTRPVAYLPEDDEMTEKFSYEDGLSQPVVLYGTATIPVASSGAPDNSTLQNPYETPIEILEVRFRIYPTYPNADNVAFQSVTGMGVGVKMDLGKAAVIDGFVPVNAMSSNRDSYEGMGALYSQPAVGLASEAYQVMYGWRPRYPIYVPGRATLACAFQTQGQIDSPIVCDVVYIGRTWPVGKPKPRTVKVPWVASFEATPVETSGSTQALSNDVSASTDVQNPFAANLELDKIFGRMAQLTPLNPTLGSGSNRLIEDSIVGRLIRFKLKIRSSRGFDILRNQTQFGSLFTRNWIVWDIPGRWELVPREFYTFAFQASAETLEVATPYTQQSQPSVGIVGYRNVAVADLGGVP